MTEIRRGAQAQGNDLVSGAVSLAHRATRIAEGLSRTLQENLKRDRAQSEAHRAQSETHRAHVAAETQQRDAFLRSGGGPATSPQSQAVARVAARATQRPIDPMVGVDRGPSINTPHGPVPATTLNSARDARMQDPRNGGAGYVVRGIGGENAPPMVAVEAGGVRANLGEAQRAQLQDFVENNPRAFGSFAEWVNATMGLRGESLSDLTPDRLVTARQIWSQPEGAAHEVGIFDPASGMMVQATNDPVTGAREIAYDEHGRARPLAESNMWPSGSGPLPNGHAPADAPSPEALAVARNDLMDIVRRNRQTSGSRTIDARAGAQPSDPVIRLPPVLSGLVRRAQETMREGRVNNDIQRQSSDLGNKVHDMNMSKDYRPKGAEAAPPEAAAPDAGNGSVAGVSFADPGQPIAPTGSRALDSQQQRQRELAVQPPAPDTSTRLTALQDRIASSPLASAAVGAATLAGGGNVSANVGGFDVTANAADQSVQARRTWRW